METPATPTIDINETNKINQDNNEDDDEQNFYSAPPSRTLTTNIKID
jgi:hypothetical protein